MTMLCRVYREDSADVVPAPWRQANAPTPMPPGRARRPAGEPVGEAAGLRAQIEQLNAQAEKRAKEAWEQGARAGEAKVRKEVDDQVRAAAEALAKALADMDTIRSEVIRQAEADTVRLAVEIARRVLHRELTVDTGALAALTRAAIEKLRNQEICRVRVHPDQEKLLRACLNEAGRGDAVEVISDPTQSRGGASFELNRGTLDASVDTQLREIENGLVDEMKRRA